MVPGTVTVRSEISASKSAKRVWPVFQGFWRNCPGREIFTLKSEEEAFTSLLHQKHFPPTHCSLVTTVTDSNTAFCERRIRNVLHLIGQ